jgi:hypothetical protein
MRLSGRWMAALVEGNQDGDVTGRDNRCASAAWMWAFASLLFGCAHSLPGPVPSARLAQPEVPAPGTPPPVDLAAPPPTPPPAAEVDTPPAAGPEPPAATAKVPEPPPVPHLAGTGPAEPDGEAGVQARPAQAEPPLPAAPGPPAAAPPAPKRGWLEGGRYVVEQGLGDLVEAFDLFFDKNRKLDLESPSSRFRFKTFVRTAGDVDFASGFAVAASVKLPRLERWLGNARLVVVGEKARPSLPAPPVDKSGPGGDTLTPAEQSDAAAAELARGRGRSELRFDVVRRGVLVFDSGVGVKLVWPPVPYVNFRAHLRLQLGAGFLLRATDTLFVEFWGRNPGTNIDLEVERYLGRAIRLRWEGHSLYAGRDTRGFEWSTLVGADWRAHRRTGFFGGLGCNGFSTPSPSLDSWRAWVGVRQDVWGGWIFVGLEPDMTWPRPPGLERSSVWGVTARLEVVLESHPLESRPVVKGTMP